MLVDGLNLCNLKQFNGIKISYGRVLDLVLSNDKVFVSDYSSPLVPCAKNHGALSILVSFINCNPLDTALPAQYSYNKG